LYKEAREAYQAGLTIFEEIHNVLGIITAHHKLGDCATEQGDYPEAWRQFQRALRTANSKVTPQVMDTLTSIAALWHKQGNIEQAVAILEIARSHPVSSARNRQRASTLLIELSDFSSTPALLDRAEADAEVKHLIDETLLATIPEAL
jgi:TolA-binding protein